MKKISQYIVSMKQYISTSGIIKLCIKIILLCSILIVILESKDPEIYSISELKSLDIDTPILVIGNISTLYVSESFSMVSISSYNSNLTYTSIIGTLSDNISNLEIKKYNKYKIIGKISMYNSEKQVSIYSINTIK